MTRTIGGKALCYLNERRWNCSARKVSLDISEWGAMGIEFLLVTFMDERLAGRWHTENISGRSARHWVKYKVTTSPPYSWCRIESIKFPTAAILGSSSSLRSSHQDRALVHKNPVVAKRDKRREKRAGDGPNDAYQQVGLRAYYVTRLYIISCWSAPIVLFGSAARQTETHQTRK